LCNLKYFSLLFLVNKQLVSKPFDFSNQKQLKSLHITFFDYFDTMAPDITATLANNTNSLVKQASISSCAYVTFLAGDGDYWKGVVGLAKGLRKAKSNYPLVVAILPDVPEEHRKILASQGCIVREIEPVNPPENQTQFAMAYYVINYSKLRIWEVCMRV
jgi:hypothetical protein